MIGFHIFAALFVLASILGGGFDISSTFILWMVCALCASDCVKKSSDRLEKNHAIESNNLYGQILGLRKEIEGLNKKYNPKLAASAEDKKPSSFSIVNQNKSEQRKKHKEKSKPNILSVPSPHGITRKKFVPAYKNKIIVTKDPSYFSRSSHIDEGEHLTSCPKCHSQKIIKNGKNACPSGEKVHCNSCDFDFEIE